MSWKWEGRDVDCGAHLYSQQTPANYAENSNINLQLLLTYLVKTFLLQDSL